MPLDATVTPTPGLPPAVFSEATVGLVDRAQRTMERVFADGGHRPSANQWAALRDYLEHVELMAEGRLPNPAAAYVSAIPAGTGKSVAVAAVAGALVTMPAHEGVGVLIAVSRLAEAVDMAVRLKAHRDRLCMIVGQRSERMAVKHEGYDGTTTMLGLGAHETAEEAQIVVTTQAALKEALKRGADFSDARRYHYRGERRQVVLWDEALSLNRPVVLDGDAVSGLA